MKVIFVNRFFYPDHSATSQMLSDLAFDLAARDWQLHIVTSRQSYDDPTVVLPATETINKVVVHRVWTTRFGRGRLAGRALDYATFYVSAFMRLLLTTRRGDVIVTKTDPPLISVVAWLAARIRGAKLVNWVQDVFPEVGQALGIKALGGVAGQILRRLRNISLQSAAMNVVLGERMATHLISEGVSKNHLKIIPNWADGNAIRPLAQADNPLRRAWGLEDKFIVGYSGNMGRAHEFDTLLGAAELLKDDTGIAFLFIGGGHGKSAFEQAVLAKGLKNVRFKPYQPREILGQSLTLPDIHIISQRPEMEGLVLPSKFYGVAAAGRAVAFIGAPDGDLATEIKRLDCGAAFLPGDAAGLATFLRKLKDNPGLGTAQGQRIRAEFDAHYDQTHAVAAWEKLLKRLD